MKPSNSQLIRPSLDSFKSHVPISGQLSQKLPNKYANLTKTNPDIDHKNENTINNNF